jgi:large subunit ribosomal protein L17
MATSLILHKRITTTLAKAKALRVYVEPLITRSKEDTTHSRRMVFSYLQSKEAVVELFREVSVKVANRPGGYTRIIKMENRLGDNAEMCFIELVDFNELMLGDEKDTAKAAGKRKRRRGGAKPKTEQAKVEKAVLAEAVVEDVVEEAVAEAVVEEAVEETVAGAKEEIVEAVKEEVAEAIVEEAAEEVVAEAIVEEVVEEALAEKAKAETKEEPKPEDDVKEKKAE